MILQNSKRPQKAASLNFTILNPTTHASPRRAADIPPAFRPASSLHTRAARYMPARPSRRAWRGWCRGSHRRRGCRCSASRRWRRRLHSCGTRSESFGVCLLKFVFSRCAGFLCCLDADADITTQNVALMIDNVQKLSLGQFLIFRLLSAIIIPKYSISEVNLFA